MRGHPPPHNTRTMCHAEIRLKTLTFCAGFLDALSVSAQPVARAALIGQRMTASHENGSLLICKYAGSNAKFEILPQNGKCAPYINVQ